MAEIPTKMPRLDADVGKYIIVDDNGNESNIKKEMCTAPSIEPIDTLEQLLKYDGNCPTFVSIKDQIQCLSLNFSSDHKMSTDGSLRKTTKCPKLLVCHDFRGGYGDDRFINGTCNLENYSFQHWLQTDIFVYFSHKFVTIPTLGWINAAHKHGVKILGTIITESDDGKIICEELLKDSARIDEVVKNLCKISEDYKFDGYLVNIENPVENVAFLLEFVEKLTKKLKQASSNNLVIYYDSIINDGKLKWQNELNELNKPFFDYCDGIFLNYCWKDEHLDKSIEIAGGRSFDVFVGVDVFGRGCFGGGGLSTNLAIKKISNTKKLSTAIFAPAWTFECHTYKMYPKIDGKLWAECSKFFNYKCWTSETKSKSTQLQCGGSKGAIWNSNIIFQSDFNRGFGSKWFKPFQEPEIKPWFNLSHQSLQPLMYPCDENLQCFRQFEASYDTEIGFQGGGSLLFPEVCFDDTSDNGVPEPEIVYRICFPLDISLSNKTNQFLAILCVWKFHPERNTETEHSNSDETTKLTEDSLVVGFTFLNDPASANSKEQAVKIIPIPHISQESYDNDRKRFIFQLSDFMRKMPESNDKCFDHNLTFRFGKNLTDSQYVNGWNLSCNLLDLHGMSKHGLSLQGVHLGSLKKITVGFVSVLHVQQ